MDLSFGQEYETFRAEVRAFLESHADVARPAGTSDELSPELRAWQRTLIEHGYAARTIPKEYGGYGG